MAAVWFQFCTELRARWRGWLVLAILAGLVGGLVMAAGAGARRADSAYTRYRTYSHATDALLSAFAPEDALLRRRVERLPEVAAWADTNVASVAFSSRAGEALPQSGVKLEVGLDGHNLSAIDRPKLLAGRLPDPGRADEAIADARALRILGLEVGDTARIYSAAGHALPVRLHIVGKRPDSWSADFPSVVTVTPAFWRAYGHVPFAYNENRLKVRLKRGDEDLPAFVSQVRNIGGFYSLDETRAYTSAIRSTARSQAQVIWIVAVLGAAAALVLFAQALVRAVASVLREQRTLRALGMTSAQVTGIGVALAVLVGVAAAAVAVLVALGLSPLTPLGLAREYEPQPGVELDGLSLAAGVGVILVAALAAGLVGSRTARRRADRASARQGRPWLADRLAGAGLPPAPVAGVRMVFPGRGSPTSGPARRSIVGSVVAVAVAATALAFSASLSHLIHTPRLYGLNWDYASGGQDFGYLRGAVAMPSIADAALGSEDVLTIGGKQVPVAAYDQVKGNVPVTVLEGRVPSKPDEILLGSKTFASLGARIGGRVEVSVPGGAVSMRVVGRGVPLVTHSNVLGEGAAMTLQALKRIFPSDFGGDRLLLRIAPGADRQTVIAQLEREFEFLRPAAPAAVADFGGIRNLPLLVAGLFGLAAAAALAHALASSIRSRRRELAILKTLGFTRGQVLATVAWQATTVAVIGLLVGLPLGIALGRWAWNLFANNLGVVPEPVTPVVWTLLAIPATLLLANLVALLPGRVAARTRPALVLRAE